MLSHIYWADQVSIFGRPIPGRFICGLLNQLPEREIKESNSLLIWFGGRGTLVSFSIYTSQSIIKQIQNA